MSSIPPLLDNRRLYAESIHPKDRPLQVDFFCYAPDLAKSVPWYEALFGFSARKIGLRLPQKFAFYKGQGLSSAKGEWIFYFRDHTGLHSPHIECGVYSLFDMHAVIGRMRNIGVEMSNDPLVNEIIEDYPKGWMRYKDNPGMAHYIGRRSHHTTACGFIDPAGTPVIVRLEVQEEVPGFGLIWK